MALEAVNVNGRIGRRPRTASAVARCRVRVAPGRSQGYLLRMVGLAFSPMPLFFLAAMVSFAMFAVFRFALFHGRHRGWYRFGEGDGRSRGGFAEEAEVTSERLENRIFRLAYRLGGRLTVSDLVVDTNLTSAEAEEVLGGLVDHSRVTMEVRDDGLVFYEFPEIIDRRGRGDDLPLRG